MITEEDELADKQKQVDFLQLTCFNYPLLFTFFSFFIYYVCVPTLPAALMAPKRKGSAVGGAVYTCRVHRKTAQGRPVDNYKLFNKHSLAAPGDILMVNQWANRVLMRQTWRS